MNLEHKLISSSMSLLDHNLKFT